MAKKDNNTECTYELQDSFEYALKGNAETAAFITLKAPTSRNMSECADLKQAWFRSMGSGSGDGGSTASSSGKSMSETLAKLDGDSIIMMISMSTDVDLKNVLLTARELFASGVALVDGETKLTKPLLDEMTNDDLESMVGKYMLNFILASALKKMKNL